METHARPTAPIRGGLALMVAGFLLAVASYFWLPLYTGICFDTCNSPPSSYTAWEFTQNRAGNFTAYLALTVLYLVLIHLPLLAGLIGMYCAIAYAVRPRPILSSWSKRAWVIQLVALIILLPALSFLIRPGPGYLGMVGGCVLFWAGNRLLFPRHPLP